MEAPMLRAAILVSGLFIGSVASAISADYIGVEDPRLGEPAALLTSDRAADAVVYMTPDAAGRFGFCTQDQCYRMPRSQFQRETGLSDFAIDAIVRTGLPVPRPNPRR